MEQVCEGPHRQRCRPLQTDVHRYMDPPVCCTASFTRMCVSHRMSASHPFLAACETQPCLERSQEIQHSLFIDLIQSVEIRNDLIGFRGGYNTSAGAGMGLDGFQQIFCASIVQEKNPFP